MAHITRFASLLCTAAVCATLLLASCSVAGPRTHGPDFTPLPQLGQPFQLGIGASMTVAQVRLTFRGVSDDSRCPSERDCDEEGLVRATVGLEIAAIPHGDVALTLFGHDRETRRSQAHGGGYIVRLVAMTPYPTTAPVGSNQSYVATFIVEQAAQQAMATYRLLDLPTYQGVIVPENAARAADPQAAAYWTPSDDDIAEFEAGLAPFVRAAAPHRSSDLWQRQATYKRQYAGIVREGKRLIYANFLCDDMQGRWKTTYVIVMDGGDCFFQATYDTATHQFTGLSVNGEA
ncbi:MAG TPA: hypothetical protein VFT99_23990 [Roseiflexaceae bacterium]|nr:hypothetical protein [Roseiflexaceae bacterium]